MSEPPATATEKRSFLPKIGSWKYHLLLGSVAIFILGPLGGITASYMNFSLGFFVGGQVLAGILGSVITYGYGAEGKHGANFMQTMAASVASMAAMGVLIQAMHWLGIDPLPADWKLVVYFLCIGMFGVGVGMLFTPILVDRLQLTYPSGLAVANILRALTDKRLLKRSVRQLGAGTVTGLSLGIVAEKVARIGALGLDASTIGAGLVVGARIGIPALTVGFAGEMMTPWLRAHALLGPEDPFRRVGFLVALGSIMGAAVVDLSLIFYAVARRVREYLSSTKAAAVAAEEPSAGGDWKTTNTRRLVIWSLFWGVAVVIAGVKIMNIPIALVLFAVGLVFLFIIINGISTGVSDSNPISSAFVVSVLLMAALLGLRDAKVGLLAAAILLVAVAVGVDMQQDRSTGWRLGSNRTTQFRYQVIGISMGAVMAVVMSKVFMSAYPSLLNDSYTHGALKDPHWGAAMTFKFVGALHGITKSDPTKTKLLLLGLYIGFHLELLRKLIKTRADYKAFVASGRFGFSVDFFLDAILLPSPYAASFGGFVEWPVALQFGLGGCASSLFNTLTAMLGKKPKEGAKDDAEALPEDMSTTSLVGGGLIGGAALAALIIGIVGLVGAIGLKSATVTPTIEQPSLAVGADAVGPSIQGDFTLRLEGKPGSKYAIKRDVDEKTTSLQLELPQGAEAVTQSLAFTANSDSIEIDRDGTATLPVHVDTTKSERKDPAPPKREDLCGRPLVLWAAIEDPLTKRPTAAKSEPFELDCGL